MKRWLFNLAAALSLLLSLSAAAAWAMSYTRQAWRLIGTLHSADLTRVNSAGGTVLFTTTTNWSNASTHGFWDALWALSNSGRLTLLGHAIDYEGTLDRVSVSPPSLTADPPGTARQRVVVFDHMEDSGPPPSRLGFARHSDAQSVGGVGARGWMVTMPWWFIGMLTLPIPLLWLRATLRRAATRVP